MNKKKFEIDDMSNSSDDDEMEFCQMDEHPNEFNQISESASAITKNFSEMQLNASVKSSFFEDSDCKSEDFQEFDDIDEIE